MSSALPAGLAAAPPAIPLALAAVTLALRPLNTAIAEFARLYASEFQLVPLQPLMMVALLDLSATLGLIGARLSVRRHTARLN